VMVRLKFLYCKSVILNSSFVSKKVVLILIAILSAKMFLFSAQTVCWRLAGPGGLPFQAAREAVLWPCLH